MGPGPGSGFESQTRAHCDSKILYLLSTALFKIYLHVYINGYSVYLKNIYAYLCFFPVLLFCIPYTSSKNDWGSKDLFKGPQSKGPLVQKDL